jgi:PAS domain S-box-containing protein
MMPWRAAAVTGGYLVAWLALDFFGYVIRVAPGVSPWNPADGLSLALVCVFGARTIPLLLVGPLIGGWLFWFPDDPVAVLAHAVATTVGYGIAGSILHARRTDARLESLSDAAGFLGLALLGSAAASALEAGALAAAGAIDGPDIARAALAPWAGDILGILGLGPFFLRAMLWIRNEPSDGQAEPPEEAPRAKPRIGLILAQAAITLAMVAATPYRWGVFADSPTQFIAICIVWIALTHGAAGAAIGVVGVNLALLIVKQVGNVPLAVPDQQLLLGAVGVAGILVGAAVSENRRRTAQLARSHAELDARQATAAAQKEIELNYSRAQEIAGMGSYRWESTTGEVWWSDKFYRLLGLEPGALAPDRESFHAFVHPDDRGRMGRLAGDIRSGRMSGTSNVVRIIRRDGAVRWFRLAREVEPGPDGAPRRIFGVVQDITDEHDTMQALRESRERTEVVAANMPGAVFQHRLAADGTPSFSFMSEGVARLCGVSTDQVVAGADALLDTIHPDDRTVFHLALENAAKSGAPWRQEFRVVTPAGTTWVRGAAQSRMGDDGVRVWDGVMLDINAEKFATEELKKSEERFRRIASDAPMAIAIIGAGDGLVRFANRACEDMFGYGVGDMRGIAARVVAAELGELARCRAELRRTGTVSNREMRLRRRDGAQFWGLFSFMALGAAGADEVLACGFDSSELREARAELSRQAIDLAGRIKELRCLYIIARLTNDPRRPVGEVCRELVDVLPQGLRVARQVSVRIALRGEEFKSEPYRSGGAGIVQEIAADGEAIGEIEVVLDADATLGTAAFLEEERELVETTAMHIGRMFAERDLAERLVQAQKLESLGQLTGGIAHDFNNLLTIIFGNLELGEVQCGPNVTLHKCITNAMQAARRAADLTSRLQAFSQRQALLPISAQLNDLVSGLMMLLRRTLGEKVEVVTDLAPTPTPVRIDPSQMEASLLALAVNARDAMPNGGKLTIATKLVELAADSGKGLAAGTYIELSVADTGTGMSPDVARRVFEPFFTTKDVGKGSGLGLAMVFGFLKQSDGHVEVASEPDIGTVVRLYVPLVDERAAAAREEAARRNVSASGECVLLVEDEPDVLDFVARLLRTAGYHVVTAPDAGKALELLRGGLVCDLLLTDVGLPGGMSGVELAREARKLDPGLKVVLASGYAYEHLEKSGAITEDLPLVFKPFVRRELLSRLRAALDGASAVSQNGSMERVA